MHLLTLNAAGKSLVLPRALDPSRRRLSQVIGRHVDRSRPHMIAVQRARDPLQPIEEAWVVRGRDKAGKVKPWPRRYLPADAIVVVVYLPRGGSSGGSSSSGKGTALSIVAAIAAVSLAVFGGPLGASVGAAIGISATTGALISAGVVVGATALQAIASRSKANKQATDTTQIYGVSGGGNAPKPGDRIPRGYGRSWMKPDLSQPDFSQYDGDDQILFKRHTLGLGKYHPYQVRAGKQVIWKEDGGFLAPFNDPRNAIEFVHGTASTLVPNSVVSAAGVGGLLPRPADNPSIAGPYLINQRGALITRIQVDFQFPQGISRTHYFASGNVQSNQKGAWSVVFQYAPIDASGAIIGNFVDLYAGNSGIEGARFATHPLRYTKFVDVPPGRYAVRAWNIQPDTSQNTTGDASIDACQWDAASGWVADPAIRDNVTEMALRIYATKATGAAAFGEVEIDAAAIIPVWDGSSWSDQETSKAVWAFLDVMRDQDYGGALPDDQLDLGTALGYANLLSEFDTFDGTIRGPVSVYEAAATVLLPMRAEPVHLGRYWSLVRDEPKSVRRHVITRSQIVKGSTQVVFDLDLAAGAGHVVGEFDQDGDYRNPNQTTAIYGEASLTPTRQRWTGVRTFAHAQHLTRWRAASGAFRRRTTPFGVEMEGRIYKRGDSIAVDQWFVDTRKKAGVVADYGDTLNLDADVVIEPGDAAILRDRTGREWGPVVIGQGASTRQIVLAPASRAAVEAATGVTLAHCLSDGRGEMTPVLVGALEILRENYLIQSVKPSGPDKASVEALIDDARVWDAIGATPVVPPVGSGGLSDPESPHILGLTANAVQIAAGLRCDYAIQPGRGCVSFEVQLSYDDGSHFETIYSGPVTTGSQVLNPVDPTNVALRARGFGSTGLPGPYFLTELTLPRAEIAGGLLVDLNATFAQLRADFVALQAEADDLNAQIAAQAAAVKKQAADAQAQLAATVARMRQDVQDIAEAAATVEGDNFDSKQLLKAALAGQTQDAFAAIQTEQTLRVSADQTLASTTTTVAARLGTAESAIQTETLARSSADSTQAGQITTAYSRLTTAESGIVGLATGQTGLETQVLKNGGDIYTLSQSYVTLSSTVNNPTTGGSALATAFSNLSTRASATEGNYLSAAQQLSTLNASVYDPTRGVAANADSVSGLTVQTTAIRGDVNSVATSFNTLSAQVNNSSTGLNATATYASQINAYANIINGKADAATTRIDTLSSRVNGNDASISVITGSYNGLSVKFGVIGAINGQTGGFQFTGIQQLNGSVNYAVEILGNLIVSGTITGDKLVANSITTNQLSTSQLIVNGQLFDAAATQVAAAGSGGTSSAVSIYLRGTGKAVILAFFNGNSNSGTQAGPGQFSISRDGYGALNTVNASFALFKPDSGNLLYYPGSMSIVAVDNPGAGTFTYRAQHTNGQGIGGITIVVMECSK